MSIEDAILYDAALKADLNALGALFDRYAPAVYQFAVRFGFSSLEADRIVGVALNELAANIREGMPFSGNLRLDLFKAAFLSGLSTLQQPSSPAIIPTAQSFTGMDRQAAAFLNEFHTALFLHLNPEQRNVLILRFMEDFNAVETAEILGLTADEVTEIQTSALAVLRTRIKPAAGDEG